MLLTFVVLMDASIVGLISLLRGYRVLRIRLLDSAVVNGMTVICFRI
jgi:hypothetical protein